MPLCLRAALGWSNPLGYLSDLGIASLLIVLLHRCPWWLALPVLLAWGLMTLATAELVSAVGRLPNSSDLHYLIDPQFLENSTGGGFAQPWLAATLFLGLVVWLVTQYLGRSATSPTGSTSTTGHSPSSRRPATRATTSRSAPPPSGGSASGTSPPDAARTATWRSGAPTERSS